MTGLLLEPALDAWSDWGLLDVPDPALKQLTTEQKTFRDFIATAYPDYAFHTWANKLIGLCEQIADGTLNRLIVTIPPRTGKSLL
ncbi:terminase, partial [Synechococcus lacustris str. Tous]